MSVPMILSDLERWDARGQIFQGIYLISLTFVPFDLELHAPTRWRPISCPSLTSVCLLTSSLRALYSKTEFSTVHFIYRTVHRHGYEDVTLHTINIQEQTILQNSPYPHIQSRSSRAPSWPSPIACCASYLPIIIPGRFSRITFLPRELSPNRRTNSAG